MFPSETINEQVQINELSSLQPIDLLSLAAPPICWLCMEQIFLQLYVKYT